MMQVCSQQVPLCRCIDWKSGDLLAGINHLMHHFEFQRFELAYRTLDQEESRRLCKIGQCRTCGGRLCLGGPLPGQSTADSLLEEIYRWMFEQWDARTERLADGVNCFRDMFLSVFHASDRDFVCEWLNRRGREGE